ncbi:MAG: hypothetical protein IKN53_04575 [Oscillibacter sp.]|nr:hypothetical protein [Oscillibacter sp.]
MEKTKFMKCYHYVLLPLYLVLTLWLCIRYIMSYGLPFPNVNVPVSCTITVALTEIAYVAYIALLIYLIIKFKSKTRKVYKLNMLVLFLFPFIQQIGTIITNVILYEANQPTNVNLLSYVIVYAIFFFPFFLPQIIYFKKRESLFLENINKNEDC